MEYDTHLFSTVSTDETSVIFEQSSHRGGTLLKALGAVGLTVTVGLASWGMVIEGKNIAKHMSLIQEATNDSNNNLIVPENNQQFGGTVLPPEDAGAVKGPEPSCVPNPPYVIC